MVTRRSYRRSRIPVPVQEKEKALLAEIIAKISDLFDGELTGDDKLVYVKNLIKGKLLESEILGQHATNNTKEQFANSPDLGDGIMNAIIDAFAAHSTMSKQALDSEKVRSGLKDGPFGASAVIRGTQGRGRRYLTAKSMMMILGWRFFDLRGGHVQFLASGMVDWAIERRTEVPNR